MILTTILILAVALVMWGVMGSVTDKAQMGGMVYPRYGVQSVTLPNNGVMRTPLVHVGDYVEQGQTLAMVDINHQYSVLTSTASGEVISMKEEQQQFEAFEPIVSIQQNQEKNKVVNCIIAFADFKTQRELRLDEEVQVNPTFLTREKNGYIPGHILSISRFPVSRDEELKKLKLSHFAENIFPQGDVAYEVQIELEMSKDDPTQFAWTFAQEKPVDMRTGTFCNVQVITKRRSILKYLFENVREKYLSIHETIAE